MDQFTYEFEEAPLFVSHDGFVCALTDGQVEVSYDDEGNYWLGEIFIDGVNRGERKPVHIDEAEVIHPILFWHLEHKEKDAIQSAVHGRLEDERASRADSAADYRRASRQEAA